MALIRFTENIQRHVECPDGEVPNAATVREALDAYFAKYPTARGYVLDDRGAVRPHMVVFVNGQHVADRQHLADPVPEGGTIDVFQALSGG